MDVEFDGELWVWDARPGDNWVFVSLPADASEQIRHMTAGERRGFGSVRVQARIGTTTWRTSIFPDGTRNVYVLPVKAGVRKAQGLAAGDMARVVVELLDY